MLSTRTLLAALPLLVLWHCGPSHSARSIPPLDYAELTGNDGWSLRINGDGSGTLTHRQHPLHHLDYPRRTFRLRPARRVVANCPGVGPGGACLRIDYYRSLRNEELSCPCADPTWFTESMSTAIRLMHVAVDDASSERACRMLRRAWLAAN